MYDDKEKLNKFIKSKCGPSMSILLSENTENKKAAKWDSNSEI
jgi:hypothetical protein